MAALLTCLPACCSARDAFLQKPLEGNHEDVLPLVGQCAEEVVTSAVGKLLRYAAALCQIAPAPKSVAPL